MSLAVTYLRAARSHWLIVALCTLLGGAGLASIQLLDQPNYRAETVIQVTFVPATRNQNHGGTKPTPTPRVGPTLPPESAVRRTARQVTTYTQLASTASVTRPTIDQLGLPYTPTELGRRIIASTPYDSDTITIEVLDTDPHRAAQIANAVAAELADLAANADVEVGDDQPLLTVSRSAAAPTEPVGTNWGVPITAGLLAGLALGLAAAVLRRDKAPSSQASV